MKKSRFGWVMPSYPIDGSNSSQFISQVCLNLEEIKGCFSTIWLTDHFFPWLKGYENAPLPESWTALTFLAAKFEDFSFGTNVLCNLYRNPALVAKMGATLNAFTNGRFILGIGAGWKEDEFRAYGFDFPETRLRVKALDEGIQIIKMMWRQEKPTFNGKWYRIEGAYCTPVTSPPPPIMIGAVGEKLMLRLVAKHADWWSCMSNGLDEYERKLKALEKHCDQIGRKISDIKLAANIYVLIGRQKSSILEALDRNPYALLLMGNNNRRGFAYGTPDELAEKFEKLIDLGIEHFTINFIDFPCTESLKLFCEEVIPSLD